MGHNGGFARIRRHFCQNCPNWAKFGLFNIIIGRNQFFTPDFLIARCLGKFFPPRLEHLLYPSCFSPIEYPAIPFMCVGLQEARAGQLYTRWVEVALNPGWFSCLSLLGADCDWEYICLEKNHSAFNCN